MAHDLMRGPSRIILAHDCPDFVRESRDVLDRTFDVRTLPASREDVDHVLGTSPGATVVTEIGTARGFSTPDVCGLASNHGHAHFVVALPEAFDPSLRDPQFTLCPSILSVPRAWWSRSLGRTLGRLRECTADRFRESALEHCIERRTCFELPNDLALVEPVAAELASMGEAWRLRPADLFEFRSAVAAALSIAMLHGNLEIGGNPSRAAVRERRETRPYSGRRVHVEARLDTVRAKIVVRHEGPTFDPERLRQSPDWEPMHLVDSVVVEPRGLVLIARNPQLAPVRAEAAPLARPATPPPARHSVEPATSSSVSGNGEKSRIDVEELVGDLVSDDDIPIVEESGVPDAHDDPGGTGQDSRKDERDSRHPVQRPRDLVRINRDVTDLLDIAPQADPFGED